VAQSEIVRRASYGPTSPVVGERGARTRRQIIEVTLRLFADNSVHTTLVDDIAKAAGISRATLYQYFESKEQIFLELVQESGAEMLRAVRRLGPLGPTASGFENLHWWLGELASVYEKYASMFIQWAAVDSPEAPLRPMITEWLETYTARLSGRLAEARVVGIDPGDLAIALWSILERYNYYRHTQTSRQMDDAAIDNLAVIVQLILFPATPAAVITSQVAGWGLAPIPFRGPARTSPAVSLASVSGDQERFTHLGPRARYTVHQLLDAGGRLFAAKGYHGANIDDIIADAGVARGTFYKYFDDKLDLLLTLSDDCSREIQRVSAALDRIASRPYRHSALRAWLLEFVALHHTQAGMFRVWLDGVPRRPGVERTGEAAVTALLSSLTTLVAGVPREYPLDIGAAALMLLGLLERYPEHALVGHDHSDAAEIAETMALVIERGFLNQGAPDRRRRGRAPEVARPIQPESLSKRRRP